MSAAGSEVHAAVQTIERHTARLITELAVVREQYVSMQVAVVPLLNHARGTPEGRAAVEAYEALRPGRPA